MNLLRVCEPYVRASDERNTDRWIVLDPQTVIDPMYWASLAKNVLKAEGVRFGELGLLFIDASEMARLNFDYLGEQCPTDVLAFPIDGFDSTFSVRQVASESCSKFDSPCTGSVLIGDVVVCPAYIAVNGVCHSDDVALLIVHGVLHILGYDHVNTDDALVMKAREKELLTSCYRSVLTPVVE